MALKGSIKEFALTEIFQLIFHQKKEGMLTLMRDHIQVSVLFKDGNIIRASEGDYNEVFGQNLHRAGLITDDQLGIVRYRLQNQKTTVEALIAELNFLPELELMRLSRLFTEETLYRLFHWESGDYEFQQKNIVYNANLTSPIETQFLLMEAVRQIDEWPGLLKKIPSKEMVFERVLEVEDLDRHPEEAGQDRAEDPFGAIEAPEEEEENAQENNRAWLLQQLDGQQTVQQIIDRAQMGAFAVHQGILELLKEKRIQAVKGLAPETQGETKSPLKKTLVKGLVGGAITFSVLFIYVVLYPSMRLTTLKSLSPVQELKGLSLQNEHYFIRFSLDLYYLKHNQYPDTLQTLIDEGYLGPSAGVVPHVEKWSYHLTPEGEGPYSLRPIASN